ncbi:MAG: DUF5107 domain-containing protein [Catenulispora sp.]|nr:DUF5107 domain-containing protein [Catenulispora sp.]
MSTELRHGVLRIDGADDPRAGVLPLLGGVPRPRFDAEAVPYADMARNLEYGRPATLLPYTNQDSYSRARSQRELPTLVLENEHLTATFLPGYGGRLWSLVHRPTGRELLHRNPILQPANLALRDAWVAGGVEWNFGTTGHWPLTCEPLHAVRLAAPDGTPVLRMYEFERLRRVVVTIDAWLPEGARTLMVHVALQNPGAGAVGFYWWSNIAVPQGGEMRVVAPAERAFHFDYGERLRLVGFPGWVGAEGDAGGAGDAGDAGDQSYPARFAAAADFFMDIPAGERRWIAALDAAGTGLVQTSTDRLMGRKLFQWGVSAGGKRWQEWLSGQGAEYIEIQAGLARTQLEHLELPGGETWEWVEAYGLLEADPAAVHGTWGEARAAVEEALEQLIGRDEVEVALSEARGFGAPEGTIEVVRMHRGSGWGALEIAAGEVVAGEVGGSEVAVGAEVGETAVGTMAVGEIAAGAEVGEAAVGAAAAGVMVVDKLRPFGSCDAEQQPWLDLLISGRLPLPEGDTPAAAVTGPKWRSLLEASADDWHAFYHLGLLRLADGEPEGARAAWERSVAERPNPWALRGLAHVAAPGERADLLLSAHRLAPGLRELTVETLQALLDGDRAGEALELVAGLGSADREHGRIRLYTAQAALAVGDVERVRALLEEGEGIVVDNLREGEASLDGLWVAVYPDRSVPREYDFRMTGG